LCDHWPNIMSKKSLHLEKRKEMARTS